MRTSYLRCENSLPLRCAAMLLCVMWSAIGLAQSNEPSSSLINRDAVVYSPATGKVYAVDTDQNAVWVVGVDGVAKKVPVGTGPQAIAVNPKTGVAYVANSESRNVSILDGTSDATVATAHTAARPYAIAVDESTGNAYVSNTFSNMLTVIDGETHLATNIKTGSADAMVIDAKVGKVYLMGYESDTLTVLNTANGGISKLSTGAMHQWGMAVDSKTSMLYVTHVGDSNVATLNLRTNRQTIVPTGAIPCAIAINRGTSEVYVANYGDGTVTVIDETDGRVIATIAVGQHPQAIAVDEKQDLIFVANTKDNTMSIIDGRSRRLWKTMPTGNHPYAIALDERAAKAYVANLGKMPFTILYYGNSMH